MIEINLTPEDVRKLMIWGYVDIGNVRVTMHKAAANKVVELSDQLRMRISNGEKLR